MTWFILTVFVVYGSVHLYLFVKARSVFGFGPLPGIALAAFMLVMVFSLFLIRTLEFHSYELSARVLSYVAFVWMALLFQFFCISLLLDLLMIAVRITGLISHADLSAYLIAPKTKFFAATALATVICGYGYFEATNIRTERLTIETDKLPAGTPRLVIAQISDVHLGLIIRCEQFRPMLQAVTDAKPDIFVVTGDLVDAQINHLTGLAEMLREVPAPLGRFAIMGNHEYYAGMEKSIAFIRESGLTLLRDEVVSAGPITIVGADDRTVTQLRVGMPVAEHVLLGSAPRDRFTLFLKHQPHMNQRSIGLFDLQLSGHTHKGQIYPFYHLVKRNFPKIAGLYDLGKGSKLYINRGTGTWGPPIRFLSPPEVTVIEVVRK